jgi:hypothetical protein
MSSGLLFVFYIIAGAISVVAGYRLGSRHERRSFQDAMNPRRPPERGFDPFEDPAPRRGHGPH